MIFLCVHGTGEASDKGDAATVMPQQAAGAAVGSG